MGYNDPYSPIQTGAAFMNGVMRSYNNNLAKQADLMMFKHQMKRQKAQDSYTATQRVNAAQDRQLSHIQMRSGLVSSIAKAKTGYGKGPEIKQYENMLTAFDRITGWKQPAQTQQARQSQTASGADTDSVQKVGEYLDRSANAFLTGEGVLKLAQEDYAGTSTQAAQSTPIDVAPTSPNLRKIGGQQSRSSSGDIEYGKLPGSDKIVGMLNGVFYETKDGYIDKDRPIDVKVDDDFAKPDKPSGNDADALGEKVGTDLNTRLGKFGKELYPDQVGRQMKEAFEESVEKFGQSYVPGWKQMSLADRFGKLPDSYNRIIANNFNEQIMQSDMSDENKAAAYKFLDAQGYGNTHDKVIRLAFNKVGGKYNAFRDIFGFKYTKEQVDRTGVNRAEQTYQNLKSAGLVSKDGRMVPGALDRVVAHWMKGFDEEELDSMVRLAGAEASIGPDGEELSDEEKKNSAYLRRFLSDQIKTGLDAMTAGRTGRNWPSKIVGIAAWPLRTMQKEEDKRVSEGTINKNIGQGAPGFYSAGGSPEDATLPGQQQFNKAVDKTISVIGRTTKKVAEKVPEVYSDPKIKSQRAFSPGRKF